MITRRTFINGVAVSAAGAAVTSTAKSYAQVLGANEQQLDLTLFEEESDGGARNVLGRRGRFSSGASQNLSACLFGERAGKTKKLETWQALIYISIQRARVGPVDGVTAYGALDKSCF